MADIWLNVHGDSVDKLLATVKEIDKYISNWEKKGIAIKVEGSSFSDANRQLANMESRAGRVARNLQSIGGAMKNVGGLMQSAGNLFGGKFVNTAKTMVSAFATMGAYSAAQGTVQRYDTMRMFPKMMEHLGYSASDAEQAVRDLEDAVIGLPTGLDEIVASARQLIPLTGNLKKGVNLAIAANNAFLAGGSDAQSVNYGQRQIKDLLSKGKLRSQEWDSLFTALGSGLGVIAEQMGYSSKARKGSSNVSDQLAYAESRLKSLRNTQQRLAKEGGTAKAIQKNADAINVWQKEYDKLLKKQDKSLGSFRDALKTNKIDALDFLEALEKVGTGEGELAKRANDYKDTIQATARNIKNALQKLGAAGLESLDEVLISRTGKNLPQTIVQISDAIKKNLIPALEDWISGHADDISAFLDRMKNYNWGELVGNVGKGLAQYYKILTGFFTKMSPKFIAFMSVWAGPLGRAMSAFGSAMTTVSGIIRMFSVGRAAKGAAEAADAVGSVAKIGFSLKNAFKGVALGAGVLGDIALLGGVIAEYAKVIELIGNIKIGDNFGHNMKVVTGALIGSGAATGGLIALMSFFSNPATAGLVAIGEGLTAGYIALIGEVGAIIAEYAKVIDDVATMRIPSKGKIASVTDTITTLTTGLFKEVDKASMSVSGRSRKILRNMSDSMEYVADIAEQLQTIKSAGSMGNASERVSAIMDIVDQLLKDSYDRSDKKDAKQTAETLKQTAASVGYIGDIVTVLSDSKAKIAKIIRKNKKGEVYTNLGVRIGKIVHSLMSAFDKEHLNFGSKGKKNIDENLKYVSRAVDSVGKIADVLSASKGKIGKLIRKDKDKHAYTNIGVRIGKILHSVLGAFDDAHLGFKTKEREVQMQNMERIAEATRNVSRIAKFLVRAMKNINKLQIDSQGLMHTGGSPFEQMIGNMATMLPAIGKVYDAIPEIDEGNASRAETLANALSQFPAIVKSLADIKKPIKELGVKRDDWTLGARLTTMMNGLTVAFGGVAESDFSSLQANAASLKTAINSIKNTFVTLSGIQAIVDTQFTFTNGTWDLGMKLARIMGSLAGAFSVTPTLGGTNVGSMATIAPALQAIGEALGTIASNAKSAAGGLKQAASGVKKLGSAAKDNTGNINKVAGATKQLQSAVKGIGGGGQAAAAGVTALGSAAGAQIGAISNAAGAAARLAAAINSIPTNKTVNVNVRQSGSAGTGVTSAGGYGGHGHASRFASGGSVRGPSGIDRVAAWLTNGEYVQRRSAVNYFGKAFMDRINSLDVDGALRSLSIRAGASARRGAYVTNNYRDNHANVTFNVNRASQGYSQRVASRWARSLT